MKAKVKRQKAKEGDAERRGPASFFRLLPFAFCLFLVAFGVRLLTWHDARFEAAKVQSGVTGNYKHMARLLAEGGVAGFFSRSSPMADPDTLGHPPGYPAVLAVVGGLFGESDAAIQLVQLAADSLAAVVTLLLAAEFLPRGAAVVAGLLAALAPQFAWNSALLLPDTLAVLPLVVAVYCLARAVRRPHVALFLAAGALVGLSCWLRANALLLAPFLAAAVFLIFDRENRRRYALAVVAGAVLVVAPLTLRNALVFRAFIPVSLGAGQTVLEGIADYDPEHTLGIPPTDLGIMQQEAAQAKRPDYAETLFGPDAISRDRARLARARGVISRHTVWFASVMARRAASMLRLERARRVSTPPQITNPPERADRSRPVWSSSPAELAAGAQALPSRSELARGEREELRVIADDAKDAPQFASAPFEVEADTDYLLEVPLAVTLGRMSLGVGDAETGATLASTIVEAAEGARGDEQELEPVQLPFVSTEAGRARLLFSDVPSATRPVVRVGGASLFKLGAASLVWTRAPRLLVSAAQRLFITAIMLPLAVAGLVLLVKERRRAALVLLLAVPVYYFCVQSALHTEYRYVLAIHHFLFALAAFALYRVGVALLRGARGLRHSSGVAAVRS